MSEFKIEKGIPLRGMSKYPFAEMEVGDSFAFPNSKRNVIGVYAYRLAKKDGAKFEIRRVDQDGYRIWRIA